MSSQSSASCEFCHSLQKQLKIQKADYQFQLKKAAEDKSTEKAMYQIHLQKQVRKWQQSYQKQKNLREQENHNWLTKYDGMVAKYSQQIQRLKNQFTLKNKNDIDMCNQKHINNLKEKTTVYEAQIRRIQQQKQITIKKLSEEFQNKIEKTEMEHESYINTLKKAYSENTSQLQKRMESQIIGAQSQLKKQEQLHLISKKQAKEIHSNLYQQIFGLNRTIAQFQRKFEQACKQIKSQEENILQLQQLVKQLNIEHENNLDQAAKIKKIELGKQKEEYLDLIRKNREEQIEYCKQYQTIILKMEDGRAAEKQLYLSNIQDIRSTIEARMSRPEDIQEIEQLREKLAKKTKQCQIMIEELKWYRLELENKEETYNKIFVPLGPNSSTNNENLIGKRKQFKLRRQGRSVTTVREILQSMNSNSSNCPAQSKKNPFLPKPKVL